MKNHDKIATRLAQILNKLNSGERGNKEVENLINNVFSNNPCKTWEQKIYMKSFMEHLYTSSIKVAADVLVLYGLNSSVNLQSKFNKMKAEKREIRITF